MGQAHLGEVGDVLEERVRERLVEEEAVGGSEPELTQWWRGDRGCGGWDIAAGARQCEEKLGGGDWIGLDWNGLGLVVGL